MERRVSRLKQWCAGATRYEKRAANSFGHADRLVIFRIAGHASLAFELRCAPARKRVDQRTLVALYPEVSSDG